MGNMTTLNIVLAIYLAGCMVAAARSFYIWFTLHRLRNQPGTEFLDVHIAEGTAYYWLKRIILWPLYLFLHTSPITLLSETFFKRYGNPNAVYYGNRGIKNFCNDLFKGKNRYAGCQVRKALCELDKNSKTYQESLLCGDGDRLYVQIIYAKFKGKYLMSFAETTEPELCENIGISRFELDQCQRLSEAEFKVQLMEVVPQRVDEIMNTLKS